MRFKTLLFGIIFLFGITLAAFGQTNRKGFAEHPDYIKIEATTVAERTASMRHRHEMRMNSIFQEYPVRNVGPIIMSGRVTDIAVDENLDRHFYVAYASGGVFETWNSGNTMKPIFDNVGALTIGDIAISRANGDIIWVGTGENNSSRSSYAGDGIYKSTDAGETWQFMGLRGSQHIGRIVTHPTNPDIAWVASLGPLYSMNDVRGVYKTTDGGQTWTRTLTPPDSTGVIDLIIHPGNPNILWAATWQRFRQAWNFKEGGNGSAIYKSTDGGETWHLSMEGFPDGQNVGRIGLAVSKSNPNILYAFLDNQLLTKEKKELDEDQLESADFLEMSTEEFLSLENEKLEGYLNRNNFPEKYTARSIKQEIKTGLYEPKALATYLEDANSALFETNIKGAQVYRSEDGGQSWELVNNYKLDNVIYTYGYYFGLIRVSPTDPNTVYIGGVPLLKSTDGGNTWKEIAENQPVHVDHHALWIDPNDPKHLLLGNDGGLYESHDGGINFIHHNSEPVGQFYSVAIDMEKPYNIYGGLQDNGVWTGSSQGSPNDDEYWERVFGGDGMHVAVNYNNSDLIYTGFQYGNYFRINQATGKIVRITPTHELGKERFRYNWNSPIEMSNHNPDILYFGTQKVLRSFDRGETWQVISPDLTIDRNWQVSGNVPYSTITTISESPVNFNVIWAGTDDGNIWVTRNGGEDWKLVSEDLPQNLWISEVHASVHNAGTAYMSMNGYRYDNFTTYLYKTTDFGETWSSIKGNLPESTANVIIQDPKNPNILYAGLDAGTFVSLNDGETWFTLNGIPNVYSYDMVVHPRAHDLVVGTHGRSIYVAQLEPLYEVYDQRNEPVVALSIDKMRYSDYWGEQGANYEEPYQPEVEWMYWIGNEYAENEAVEIIIKDSEENTVTTLNDSGSYGFNIFKWNLALNEEEGYLQPDTYTIIYKINGQSDKTTFTIASERGDDDDTTPGVFTSPEQIEYEEFEREGEY